MIFFVSCSFFCLVVLVLVVIAVMYHGQTIIASIQFCGSSYFELLDFCTVVSTSHPVHQNPTQPPVFIAPPRNGKMGFLYPKSRYSQIFARFSPVKQSNMNRFWNGFHSRIALGKLYNIAAQSLLRHKLRCMKIIIETFSDDKWFACVSSVVFEVKSIWISRDVLARWTEQFDTTHDFLGRKLAKLENCILRSARDRFSKRLLFSNRYNKSIFRRISKRISLFGRSFSSLGRAILKFINFENS